jgi:hypothetical protein
MDLKPTSIASRRWHLPKRMATIHFHGGGFTGGIRNLFRSGQAIRRLGYVAIAAHIACRTGRLSCARPRCKGGDPLGCANAGTLGESQRIGVVIFRRWLSRYSPQVPRSTGI